MSKITNSIFFSTVRIAGKFSFSKFFFNKNYDVILCYHDISNKDWGFSVTKAAFERQIDALSKHFRIVPLQEILSGKRSKYPRLAITFDDGYESVYKNAFPILEFRKLTATVFVIGTDATSFIRPREIKKLKSKRWEIGWHTNNHVDITKLENTKLKKELDTEKKKYEKISQIKLNYFSYPYGKYDKEVQTFVKSVGFKSAFNVDGGMVNTANKYSINRVIIPNGMDDNTVLSLVTPMGLLVNRLFTFVWQIKDKYYAKTN